MWSGSFNMAETGPGSTVGLGLGNTFIAFCMDIITTMQNGQEYKINNATPFANSGGSDLSESLAGSTRIALVQNLFDSAYGTLAGNADTAAFGLALWELTHEEADTAISLSTLNVTQGNFSVASSVSGAANTMLTNALSYIDGQKFRLDFIENVRGEPAPSGTAAQNLVTATVVPLPAAGLLLFGAIGALGVASRRRKASAET